RVRLLAVEHEGTAAGHHRDRYPQVRPLQPRALVDELAAPGATPAAFEVDPPPPRPGGPRDAPALIADDPAQQVAGVAVEALRDQPVHAEEEPRLIGGADLGVRPEAADREIGHLR